MATMVSSKGQVVIPKKFRTEFGLEPGSLVDFQKKSGELRLVKKRKKAPSRLQDGYAMVKIKMPLAPPDFDVSTLFNKDKP